MLHLSSYLADIPHSGNSTIISNQQDDLAVKHHQPWCTYGATTTGRQTLGRHDIWPTDIWPTRHLADTTFRRHDIWPTRHLADFFFFWQADSW